VTQHASPSRPFIGSADYFRVVSRPEVIRFIRYAARWRRFPGRYTYLSPSIATALNPVIGYTRAAEIVKKALAAGKTIPEVCLEAKVLSEQELKKILDPHRMTQPGLPPRRKK
jgi:Fumarase C C-terminus